MDLWDSLALGKEWSDFLWKFLILQPQYIHTCATHGVMGVSSGPFQAITTITSELPQRRNSCLLKALRFKPMSRMLGVLDD